MITKRISEASENRENFALRQNDAQAVGENAPHAADGAERHGGVQDQTLGLPSAEHAHERENERQAADQTAEVGQGRQVDEEQAETLKRIAPVGNPSREAGPPRRAVAVVVVLVSRRLALAQRLE